MSGKISPDGFSAVKTSVREIPDAELAHIMKSIWEETTEFASMDPESKSEILSEIHTQMQPPKRQRRISWWKIGAAALLPALLFVGAYAYFPSKKYARPQPFTVVADPGHKTQIYLPDGTHVLLNSDSRLTYCSDFNVKNRKVKLEGEAFFDVSKKDDKKFTVETGTINVVVHGTAFNVSSYADDPLIKVALLRGEITLEDRGNPKRTVQMAPDQKVLVSKETAQWSVAGCDSQIESLWTQNMLKFDEATVGEVFRKLERWYGMDIHITNPDTALRYSFMLKSESLAEMLNLINRITPVQYTINGKEVTITYKKR